MFLTDLHTHTLLSMDGQAALEELAGTAIACGLSALCVTDHCDLLDENGVRRLEYDWAPALAQHATACTSFLGRLELRLGIELGGAYASPPHARAILAGAGDCLDMVIGSVHNYSEARGGRDFFYDTFDSPEKCRAALDDYFGSMAQLAKLDECYDVLGHIIYPLRYMQRDGQEISLENHWDVLEDILRSVIRRGKAIEVNTCRGRSVDEWRPVLELYKRLGGTLITVGSDAHQSRHVGAGIPEAYALLRELDFPYAVIYRRRRPERIPLA